MNSALDPAPLDWARMELPDSWIEELNFFRPSDFWRFFSRVAVEGHKVVLPPGLPGGEDLPSYLLQDFHRMPNGTYSKNGAEGYRRWFNFTMLGEMSRARKRIVAELSGARAALDLGCGAGDLAGALRASGINDVWALDPCPYLLKEGAAKYPGVRFVQGIAEKSPFPDERFDAVAATFLFHELPGEVADQALAELRRVMKPGGRLVIVEPSPVQLQESNLLRLFRFGGARALYFRLLAKVVYEPFVLEWHRKDPERWLSAHGFRLLKDEIGMPMRTLSAVKA